MQQFLTVSYDRLLIVGLVFAGLVLVAYVVRRWREDHRAKHKLEDAIRLELTVPTSLHPVIDPDICIGSGSCITACPEGKILGLVDGIATLLNAAKCIGHGKCAVECPVNAIKLVFGMAERGVDLPEVDEWFETSRPGVHIVGELAGMGLIKNALIQGLQVAGRFKDTIDKTPATTDGAFDVIIVGAGPSGIATAVGCKAAGLSYALIEQDTVGGTVAHYPRQKLVMTQTIDLPFYGPFGQTLIRKEQLIESFEGVIKKAGLKIHEKTRLTGIGGEKDNFVVSTDKGALTGKRVVLSIGRRGTPRKLGCPGEDLDKVAYRLIDARQYAGKKVLVVGGGDSALEAAIQLADDTDAEVGISYRRPEFGRCRPLNKQKIDAHLKSGRVKSYMATEIVQVERESVTLKNGENKTIPNDYVLACLGGELPNELLKSMGISIRKHLGDKAMANPALAGKKRKARGKLWGSMFALLGVSIVAALLAVGYKYYLLPRDLRYASPYHASLKPSGLWGHGVGILATMFMLMNFIYPMRKRMKRFKGKGSIVPWMRFHVFVGIMSPLVILFHTAFQWGNQLATTTYFSLVVVFITGLIGRWIYGWMRLDPDEVKEADQLGKVLAEFTATIPQGWKDHARLYDAPLNHVLRIASSGAPAASAKGGGEGRGKGDGEGRGKGGEGRSKGGEGEAKPKGGDGEAKAKGGDGEAKPRSAEGATKPADAGSKPAEAKVAGGEASASAPGGEAKPRGGDGEAKAKDGEAGAKGASGGDGKPRGEGGEGKPRGEGGEGKPRGEGGEGKPRGEGGEGKPRGEGGERKPKDDHGHGGAATGAAAASKRSLPALFLHMPIEALRVRRGLRHARRLFLERAPYRTFRAQVQEMRRIRTKMQFHRKFKRLMAGWRSFHVVLAIVLIALIGTHVWVSIRVGFRWLWK